MEILYAFDNRVPSAQADTEQLVCTLAALSRRGVGATLAAPGGNGDPGAREIRDFYRVQGSFRVRRFRSPGWPRVLQKLWSGGRIAVRPPVGSADVLHTRNLPIAAAAVAAGRRVMLDTYRPWPDQVRALRPFLRRLMTARAFLGAVLHSELARRSYLRLGVPDGRLATVHNGWEPSHMQPVLGRRPAREKLGLPADRPIAVYAGRVDREKGLDVLIEVARRLPEVLFLLVGATGEGAFEREAASVANVELVPWQPFHEVSDWLYAADVLLLAPARAPVERHGNTVLPMKLFKYLAAGRPILGPRRGDVREVLEDGRDARLVPPGRADAAAAAIRDLVGDPELSSGLAAAARRTAEEYTWDDRARRIHRFLRRRLGRS